MTDAHALLLSDAIRCRREVRITIGRSRVEFGLPVALNDQRLTWLPRGRPQRLRDEIHVDRIFDVVLVQAPDAGGAR